MLSGDHGSFDFAQDGEPVEPGSPLQIFAQLNRYQTLRKLD
jgi:hypothetical protein